MPKFMFIGGEPVATPSWLADHDGTLNGPLEVLIDDWYSYRSGTHHIKPDVYIDNALEVILVSIADHLFLIGKKDGTNQLEIKDYVRLEYKWAYDKYLEQPDKYPLGFLEYCYTVGGVFQPDSTGNMYFFHFNRFRQYWTGTQYYWSYMHQERLEVQYTTSSISVSNPVWYAQKNPQAQAPFSITEFEKFWVGDYLQMEFFGGNLSSAYVTGTEALVDPFGPAPTLAYLTLPWYGTDLPPSGMWGKFSFRVPCSNTGLTPINQYSSSVDFDLLEVADLGHDYVCVYYSTNYITDNEGLFICAGLKAWNEQYSREAFWSKPSFDLTEYFGGFNPSDKNFPLILKQLASGVYLVSNARYGAVLSMDTEGVFALISAFTLPFPQAKGDYLPEYQMDVALPVGEFWLATRRTHPSYYRIESAIIKADVAGNIQHAAAAVIEHNELTPLSINIAVQPFKCARHIPALDEIWGVGWADNRIYFQRIIK